MSNNDIPDATSDEPLYCSFCNKDHEQVRKLVQGPAAMICDVCIETCADIISDDRVPVGQRVVQSPSLTARCSLCRAPIAVDDLVPVIGRGAICSACISAVTSLRVEDPDRTR